jgi:hypothetical protein
MTLNLVLSGFWQVFVDKPVHKFVQTFIKPGRSSKKQVLAHFLQSSGTATDVQQKSECV